MVAKPTGEGTSASRDVADPHPAHEEHPYRERRPGGATLPRRTTQDVNDATHDGSPPPRPENVETGSRQGAPEEGIGKPI